MGARSNLIPPSSAVYLEALELSSHLEFEPKGLSTQQRIHARVKMLEVTATAAHVFSLVQHTNVRGLSNVVIFTKKSG